ncbi:MAG TPA: hydrogenase maturation protease [Chthoniobacteraceae bacterium]|jgi:hydrogenase maturation protease|nr:hydrogenase maturation protease [Chthoniobacteraceae bacterium]
MRILVAGIGNIFMGDDAFGCEAAAALAHGRLPAGVRVEDFGIRAYDLAYAIMEEWDAVILLDALPRGEPPGTVTLLEPDCLEVSQGEPDAHSMNPMTALQMVRALGGEVRRLYVVGCEPSILETEELGLSAPVSAAVPGAVAMVESLVRELMETRERETRENVAAAEIQAKCALEKS